MKKTNKPIYVTQPTLPDLKEYTELLKQIWESKWITNNGQFHQQFEKQLAEYLGIPYISVFSNGTLALITALQVLRITGEVITTPYSFVATTHSLHWNRIKPVFVDVDEDTFNLDPTKIEAAITPQTTAILPVHVYGIPCNIEEIQRIADIYGLKVIYDAAHAFGVKNNGHTILNAGDLTVLSFHATKTFNTIEGGAIICHDEKMKQRIDYLKNFGFADETTIVAPGINAKMNELQAAYGILQLNTLEENRLKRQKIWNTYQQELNNIKGLTLPKKPNTLDYNYSYFPILVDKQKFGLSRDELYDKLKKENIYSRKYFYPLISNIPAYRGLDSAKTSNLPVANKLSEQVLCLPIHSELSQQEEHLVVKNITNIS